MESRPYSTSPKKGRGDARAILLAHADGAHRVEPQQAQRLLVHDGKARVPARVRVDAAEARQPLGVAAQVQFRQAHVRGRTDRDFQHAAIAPEIDHDFAVERLRKAHQQRKQAVGRNSSRANSMP